MSVQFKFVPYKRLGDLVFGMKREEVKELLGEPISSQKYGYPNEDRFLDDYGFFYAMCSKDEILEAIEFFPSYSKEEVIWIFNDKSFVINVESEAILQAFQAITDDLTEKGEESYISEKLGVRLYCPEDDEDDVASIIVHDLHYYDEEKKYLEDLEKTEL